MREKLLVRDPTTNRTLGVRVDGKQIIIGGPSSSQPLVDQLLLSEDDILLHRIVALKQSGWRFRFRYVFKTESGLASTVERWKHGFEVCSVRSFRRLMR